jgi:hypothetical protein
MRLVRVLMFFFWNIEKIGMSLFTRKKNSTAGKIEDKKDATSCPDSDSGNANLSYAVSDKFC